MRRSPVEATPVRALPAEGNEEGAFEHFPPHRARNNNPPPRPRKEQHQQLLPDHSLNQELTNSTFDGSNASWSSSDWNGPRPIKSEPLYKYQGSYQAGDWSPSYGVMHHQSSSPSASSSSYYDASNDYYGYGYSYGQQAPYGMQQQQHSPYPPCDAPYNGSRIPAGKQMVQDYRRQNRFGVDAQGRIQHIKREPDDGPEQDGENFTTIFTTSMTSLYSQDVGNAFPDDGKNYDSDIMILDPARPHAAMDDGGYQRMNVSYGMGTAGYPNHQGPRQSFGGYYENRNQIPELPPSVVQDVNAESERVNSFRYDRPSFDDMHLYASSPNDTKIQPKKRKMSTPNAAPEGGSENRRKGPRLASFKSDSKWTPNSFAFSDITIKQEPLDDYEDGESQSRCLADNSSGSNGNAVKASSQPADQPPKPVVRKRSPGTTCFDRFEKKSTPASKKVSPLSVYAKVQDSLVLSVKCRRYKKRTKPITAKEESTYPGREEIENWKRTGAYSQSPDLAVQLLVNELIGKASHLGDRSVPEGPELPPVDLKRDVGLLIQFCKRYSIDYSDFENVAELKPRMVATEPTKNFERASAIHKRTNISPVRSRTPTRAEVKAQKGEKVTRKVAVEAAKSRAEVAKTTGGKRNLRKLPGRRQRGKKLRGRGRKTPVVVTRRYSTRSAKEDGHSDVDIVIGSSSEDEKEAGKEAEVPKKSQRLKNKHPVVETPAKTNNIDRNNFRNCVKKEDVNIRSRSRKTETGKQEEVAKLASLKKKWSQLHQTECTLAESEPVGTSGKDSEKTESNNLIKNSDKHSNKGSPKISSRKSADKIICDSVLSSPMFNLFSRQTRRKSFDVVEIDCDEKEVKPADDKSFIKLVKHSETKPNLCNKPLIKKEPVSPERKRGRSRDNSLSKTRLKSSDMQVELKKISMSKYESLKEVKKKFQADIPIKDENPVEQVPRGQSFSESEKRQAVILKLERRSQRKDVPKASEKRLPNTGKPAECDNDSENSYPKKSESSQIIDKTDSVVQIKLTKLPLNFSCESSSFSESLPEDSFKVIIKNGQSRSTSRRTHSRKGESKNENSLDASKMVTSFLKPKNDVLETESKCDRTDGHVCNGEEDSLSKNTCTASKRTSETMIFQPETSEVPHRRKRNQSKCTDNNTKANRLPKDEIPYLEPKIVAPVIKESDTATPSFDLRTTILKIKDKMQSEFSGEQKVDKRDTLEDKSPSTEPPKLDCMKENHLERNNPNSKENKSDPDLGETSTESQPIVCERMPSIFPVSSVEEGRRPQPISIHRRSDSDDSNCGGLVIDLDRRQSVEDLDPSPSFETNDPKASKDTEHLVQREPTPSTSGYSTTSRDNDKWGMEDSYSDDECSSLECERRRPMNITFSSLRTAAREHAQKYLGQEPTRPPTCNISPESKDRIQNNLIRIMMHQANNNVSASTAVGGFEEHKPDSNLLPTDMNANIKLESEEGENGSNPVDAKEKIRRLKEEITYLQIIAEENEREKNAIVCFTSYKEKMLQQLMKEYSCIVQEHVQDWMFELNSLDPMRTSSGTQTCSFLSFVTSLTNASAQTELSMANEILCLACPRAEGAACGMKVSTPNLPSDSHNGEQLPAVATMVASATENYGVDMRTMRNGISNPTVPTILQRALTSVRADSCTTALGDLMYGASMSRSPTSTETPHIATTTSGTPHHRQSFRTYQRSRSPPLHSLRASRQEDCPLPIQEFKPPTDVSSRSPPALQPELRQPVLKIFSPQPEPSEKQQPLDLMVTTTSGTVIAKAAPTKKTENSVKVTASSSELLCHPPNSVTPSAETENLKPEASSSKSENRYGKPGTEYTEHESHSKATVSKTETTYRMTTASSASGSRLHPRDPVSVPGPSTRDSASDSGLPPRNPPSDSNFTFESRCASDNCGSSTCSKPEVSRIQSQSPFSQSESPFTKPGPLSSKPLEAATFKEGSRNRRVTSNPRRRPPGQSYSAWNGSRNPDPPATLDLRIGNSRSKDNNPPQPAKEPSVNSHSSPSQRFMTVPPPTMLQQSLQPRSSNSSGSHHHEASHKDSIERIYTRRTEEELRSVPVMEPVSYPIGLAYPLVKMAASLPETAGSGVKCLGCGVSDAKFLCSGCRTHYYCSPHCQSMLWPEHSQECGRFFE